MSRKLNLKLKIFFYEKSLPDSQPISDYLFLTNNNSLTISEHFLYALPVQKGLNTKSEYKLKPRI